jgi:beta-glucosidase/6-phospho-beta-glucosidase/beta-galactosidase
VLRTFPRGFRWGVATSGHQTEGGNTGSDTWFLEHVRPTVERCRAAGIAPVVTYNHFTAPHWFGGSL